MINLPVFEKLILRVLLPDYDFEYTIGFYEEGYLDIKHKKSSTAACIWLWGQIFKAAPELIKLHILGEIYMIMNYLKTAVRNILRHKGYSLINILGLGIGLTDGAPAL